MSDEPVIVDETDPHDHCGIDCPQCQAASRVCAVLGGFAEGLQKMLDDGVFERLGEQMAMLHEQAFMDAFLGKGQADE